MNILKISASIPANCTIIDAGDLNFGSPRFDLALFDELVKEVSENSNTFLFLKGNLLDQHKYAGGFYAQPAASIDAFIEKLTPVAGKILALGCSDKEAKKGVGQAIASRLNVPFGGSEYHLHLNSESESYIKIYVSGEKIKIPDHTGNQAYRNQDALLKHLGKRNISDCVYAAVSTKRNTPSLLKPLGNRVDPSRPFKIEERWHVASGGFFQNLMFCSSEASEYEVNEDYAMAPPEPTGYARIHVAAGQINDVELVRSFGLNQCGTDYTGSDRAA